MAGFLDDPSPLVRRALADAFASAIDAPRVIVLALADDEPGIASIVLSRSPLFADAELVDCAATAASVAQAAIASRPGLSAAVAAAIAEVGSLDAVRVLAQNADALLPGFAILRMLERHGGDVCLRDALATRGPLPIDCRFELAAASARDLCSVNAAEIYGRSERDAREAIERAAIEVAAGAGANPGEVTFDDLWSLAQHLRRSGRLTASFAFRVVLSGHRDLFVALLTELSGMPAARVEGLIKAYRSAGFAALYRKAGFPAPLLSPMRLALAELREWEGGCGEGLCLPLVTALYERCIALGDVPYDNLLVVLRRFELEATRVEARRQRQAPPIRAALPAAAPASATALVPDDFWAGAFDSADENNLEILPGAGSQSEGVQSEIYTGAGLQDASLAATGESIPEPATGSQEAAIDIAPFDFARIFEVFTHGQAARSFTSPVQAVHQTAEVFDMALDAAGDARNEIEGHALTAAETLDLLQGQVDRQEDMAGPAEPWFRHAVPRKKIGHYNPCADVDADLSRFEAELFAA